MEEVSHNITIEDIDVLIVRKKIKNMNLRVYPPDGRVRMAVPLHMNEKTIFQYITANIPWVKQKQALFKAQAKQSPLEINSGESIYYLGQPYHIEVIERSGYPNVMLKPHDSTLFLFISPKASMAKRKSVLSEWCRSELKKTIPPLQAKWEPIIGKSIAEWGIKKMKTRWGSCNISDRRIWLNVELIHKPFECIEYVFVHEMVHLYERYHNDRFKAYMDKFLPDWRVYKDKLNASGLC